MFCLGRYGSKKDYGLHNHKDLALAFDGIILDDDDDVHEK